MPRFFFHMEDRQALRDAEGTEADSIDDAKCIAVQLIAENLCHQPMKFWEADSYKITVTDAEGLYLFKVEVVATLAPAIRRTTPPH